MEPCFKVQCCMRKLLPWNHKTKAMLQEKNVTKDPCYKSYATFEAHAPNEDSEIRK